MATRRPLVGDSASGTPKEIAAGDTIDVTALPAVQTSAGVADAGKLVALGATGVIDASMLPVTSSASQRTFTIAMM